MKKGITLALAIILMLGFTLVMAPQQVQAVAPVNTPPPLTWQYGAGVAGTPFAIDLTKMPAPNWLQLVSTGLKLSGPAKICYPFRDGQFHWVGEIREFVGGKWVKLDATVTRPNSEADYQACAQAPAEGTYALFAYYNGPAEGPAAIDCDSLGNTGWEWDRNFKGDIGTYDYIEWFFNNLPDGTPGTYTVVNQVPDGSYTGDLSGSTTFLGGAELFKPISIQYHLTVTSTATIKLMVEGCEFDMDVSNH
jgi:hypothetical protein